MATPELDRLNLLDEAVRQHFIQNYSELVKNQHNEDAPIYFATSMRAFSEMQTKNAATKNPNPKTRAEIDDSRRLPIPRVSIMRQSVLPDPFRQRPRNIRIRKISFHDESKKTIYSSPLPIPINIAYQIDFWTRKDTEMNRWIIRFNDDWRIQILYLSVDVDDFFRSKYLGLFLTSGLDDTSDLEPGEDRTLIRQTAIFEGQSWIWPTAEQVQSGATVQQIIAQLETPDGESLGDLDTACGG
jgi:hypothetical protein